MGSQFVDFNADGRIDYVTATFDGSPDVASIAVSRYAGADPGNPVGSVAAANTHPAKLQRASLAIPDREVPLPVTFR